MTTEHSTVSPTAISSTAILDDSCALVGHTPTIRLPRLSAAAGAELFGKVEYLNPGGSIKDRIAVAMVEAAEKDGRLRPGMTLVEATAGNTGLGLAWVAATRGYQFVSVMSASDKGPKTDTMEAMGSECVLIPPGAPWDSDEGPVGIGARIAEERGGVFLNQFENPANPAAHETGTAREILDTFGDSLDAVVVGVGTGGTVTGVGRGLKAVQPGIRIIGVSGEGSYLGSELEGDRIAGITPDFPPDNLDLSVIDHLQTITGPVAAEATRRLNRTEGTSAGHSSGALLLAAEDEAKRNPGSKILILLCDSVRNYPDLLGG